MDFIPSSKKKQENQSLCNLFFCSEIGCDQVFENKDLQTYLIKGCEKTEDSDAPRSSMGNVKISNFSRNNKKNNKCLILLKSY